MLKNLPDSAIRELAKGIYESDIFSSMGYYDDQINVLFPTFKLIIHKLSDKECREVGSLWAWMKDRRMDSHPDGILLPYASVNRPGLINFWFPKVYLITKDDRAVLHQLYYDLYSKNRGFRAI